MSRPASPRWPYANLDQALIAAGYTLRWQKVHALGITERTWWRWRRSGVPDHAADTAALALDTHPTLIWPHYGFTSAPPSDTEIAC